MTVISISTPKGIMPIKDEFNLPDGFATTAENTTLNSGSIVPFKDVGNAVTLPTHKQLALTPGYNIEKGPIHDDYFDRYYYTTNIQGDRMKVLVVKPSDLIVDPIYNIDLDGDISPDAEFTSGDEIEWTATDIADATSIYEDSVTGDGVVVLNSTTMRITINSATTPETIELTGDWSGEKTYLLQWDDQDYNLYTDGVLTDTQTSIALGVSISTDTSIANIVHWRNTTLFTATQILEAHKTDTTLNASFSNLENLFDSNSETYAEVVKDDTFSFDFGVETVIDNIALGFTSPQYTPTKVKLEYSDDNTLWTEAEEIILIPSSDLQVRSVSEYAAYQYWKVTVTAGSGRLNRIEYYNDENTTESSRDVYIESPEQPTLTQLEVTGLGTPTMTVGGSSATLSSEEIKGGKIYAHFSGSGSGTINLTLGDFSANGVTLGSIYPVEGETDITYNGEKVGAFKLLSVSQEVIPGVDYSASDKNYVAVYEYELYTSSSQLLTRQYLLAIEDDLGQIGPPSLPVEYNTLGSTQVTLAQLSWTLPEDENANKIIIFRSAPDGEYYKAGEVDADVTTFVDIYTEEDYRRFTPGIPLGAFGNPVDDVTNLAIMAGGSAVVSDRKKTIYISEPLKPHVMTYTRTVTGNIIGMASTGSELIVCTDQNPELITGSHPSVMTQEIVMTNQACISRESITQVKNSIIYAGTDGLVSVVGARGDIITSELLSQSDWLELNPSSMIGESHDGKYYGFTSSHTIIYDFNTGSLTTSTLSPDSAYSDIETDSLYLRFDDVDYKAFDGPSMTQTLESKHYRFPIPVTFNAIRVSSNTYNDTCVNVYINGCLGCTIYPQDFNSRRLPRMPQAREMHIEVIGTDTVNSIEIATSMGELRGV